MERWAPNGQAWSYTVTEEWADGTSADYIIMIGTDTVSANNDNATLDLQNGLDGSANVVKSWIDGEDPYGLRPETVTVQLQARYRVQGSGDEGWSQWMNAYDAWSEFVTDQSELDKQGLTADSTQKVVEGPGWRTNWTHLPMLARLTNETEINEIEYRVVEVKIGDQDISSMINASGEEVYRDGIHPYEPSQETTGDANDGYTTSITNTLESTSISATKTWVGDKDDQWDSRPENTGANNWKATFFLQRSAGNGATWQWVVEADSSADPAGSATQDGVVSLTIMGDDTSDEQEATWENLPEYDTNGKLLQYRVVEQVPGSYDVTDEGAVQVSDTDTAHRYYVVTSTEGATESDPSSQFFTNTLRTVNLTGTKAWEDFGTCFAPDFDASKAPTMTLYRAADTNGNGAFDATETEKVLQNGSPAVQPSWTDGNNDGVWEFTYENLPAADKNDNPYVYWAEETVGSGGTGGFYPVYEGKDNALAANDPHDAAGTTTGDAAFGTLGNQTNEPITNTATKLKLDKISNWVADRPLNGIELSVQSRDGSKIYGVWQRDENGDVTTWTLLSGGTKEQVMVEDNKMIGDAAGYIVGLPAGDYKVVETGEVPDGYAIAPEVNFHINADGTAMFNSAEHDGEDVTTAVEDVVNTTEDAIRTITVTAQDPVLRGHLQLTKKVSSDGTFDAADAAALEGATFDLYRVDTNEDADKVDDLIASGLTTNDQGVITTVGNDTLIEEKSSDGTFDLTYGGKYLMLSGGLPEGQYYFVETNATPGAVMPEDDAAKSEILTITQDNHYAYTNAPLSTQKGNETFNATVKLKKFDSATNEGINGTKFELYYQAPDNPESSSLGMFTTETVDGVDGVLVLPDLAKGKYRLVERSNTGYDMNQPFEATFTIDDADDDKTFDVTDKANWTDISFQVGKGKFEDGKGVSNTRLFGQVTLNKRGNSEAIDATFDLQLKQADGTWVTLVSGLETSHSYKLEWNADGKTATAAETGDLNKGQLTVTNLSWNTYRLVETATAPGYLPENTDGQITREFEISRDTPNMSVGFTLQNNQTDLEINKQSDVGQALSGAEFTITGVDATTFADGSTKKTITTDSTGLARLVGQLVVGGTYDVYESRGPSGYDPVDEHFQVTVAKDGSLDVVGGDDALPERYERADLDGNGAVDNAFSFIATNNHMNIDLTKVSADDGTTPLAGVTFRLTGECMDHNSTHTYTTGEDGTLHIDAGLMGGVKYSLLEDATPAGYLTMEPLHFYMNDRGEIEPVKTVMGEDGKTEEVTITDPADMPAGWTVNGDKISFTAADEPTRLTIEKVDGDNNEKKLPGAQFSVTPVNSSAFAGGTTEARTLTTGDDGTDNLVADLVVGNTYTIEETKAPDGYTKIDGTMTITVQKDGSIRIADGTTAPAEFVVSSDGTVQVFTGTVTNNPTQLTLNKIDATTNQSLAGAQFELTGSFADGSDKQTLDATDNAKVELDKALLIADGQARYILTETQAPGGYELIQQPLVFTVAENGTITPTDPDAALAAGWSVGQDGISVRAADKPVEIDLVKLGEDSGTTELVGAEFLVKPAEGSAFANATESENENGISVTPENISTQLALKLKVGNTYTIEETLAPSEYETVPGTLTFTVNDNGTLAKVSGPDAWAISEDGGVAVVTATDKPIEVVLQKVSAADNAKTLVGATFELYKVEASGVSNLMDTISTGADGTLALDGLVGGATYTLHEVIAPAGYELLPDVTFTVTKNGSVELEGETAGYTVAQDNEGVVTITAADTPINAQLVKTDEVGMPLAGAIFTIQGTFAGDYEGESEITLAPSDANGIVTIPSAALIAGETYTVAEITAPDGFERAGIVKFVVGTDGAITLVPNNEGTTSGEGTAESGDAGTDANTSNDEGTSAGATSTVAGTNGSGTYTASADGGMAVITATNHPVEVTITKTDGGEGLLPGAEFTATAKVDGDQGGVGDAHSVTATTDENGVAVLSGLIAGTTYTLVETKAPAGYELLTDTLEFTVQPDGTIDAGWFPPAAFSIGTAKDSVTVADNPLEVSLVKRAPNGAPLAGAEFTVEGQFPDGEISKTFTSDESGIVFNQIQLAGSAEGTHYTVTETKAPEGYALPEGSLDLVVFEDGTVQVADGSSADMKENASVEESNGVAIVSLNNEPLPGTELPKTSDSAILPLIAGALGLLGLWALVMGGIAYRRFRGSED